MWCVPEIFSLSPPSKTVEMACRQKTEGRRQNYACLSVLIGGYGFSWPACGRTTETGDLNTKVTKKTKVKLR